ncbi:MAG TPA: hypothetical protein VM491_10655, partial [Burkholderiaceae bacterium]|nr:hypothetical protein [Burkholderiaceae bacterium]
AFTHFRLRAQLWLAEAVDRAVLRGAARPPAASNGMPLPAARDAEDRALWLSLPPTADAPLPRPIRTVLLRLAQRPR